MDDYNLDLEFDVIRYQRNQIENLYYEAFDEYNNDMEDNYFDKCATIKI